MVLIVRFDVNDQQENAELKIQRQPDAPPRRPRSTMRRVVVKSIEDALIAGAASTTNIPNHFVVAPGLTLQTKWTRQFWSLLRARRRAGGDRQLQPEN